MISVENYPSKETDPWRYTHGPHWTMGPGVRVVRRGAQPNPCRLDDSQDLKAAEQQIEKEAANFHQAQELKMLNILPSKKTKMAMEKNKHLQMYLLFNMVFFHCHLCCFHRGTVDCFWLEIRGTPKPKATFIFHISLSDPQEKSCIVCNCFFLSA